MILISSIWVSMLILGTLAVLGLVQTNLLPYALFPWIFGFVLSKMTRVPYDPRDPAPKFVRLAHREFDSWAMDAVGAFKHPAYQKIAANRFKMNPVLQFLVMLTASMHAGVFGWSTLLSAIQFAILTGLLAMTDIKLTLTAVPIVRITVINGFLLSLFGLIGGIVAGNYYRWLRGRL